MAERSELPFSAVLVIRKVSVAFCFFFFFFFTSPSPSVLSSLTYRDKTTIQIIVVLCHTNILFLRWHSALLQLISIFLWSYSNAGSYETRYQVKCELGGVLYHVIALSLRPLLMVKLHYLASWESECASNSWLNPDVPIAPFMFLPCSDLHIHILCIIFQYLNRCIFTQSTFLQFSSQNALSAAYNQNNLTCFMLISCLLLCNYIV